MYKEKSDLEIQYIDREDGRKIAKIFLEGYLSTKVKDGSGDIIEPSGIDFSRFEAGNSPLKAMHGRTVLSNIGTIYEVNKDEMGAWIKAYTMLDITKDANGRPINDHDYVLFDRISNRTVNGFSIGFIVNEKYFDKERGATVFPKITAYEGSVVDIPDNPLTVIKALQMFSEEYTKDIVEGEILEDNANVEESAQEVTEDIIDETEQTTESIEEVVEEKQEDVTAEEETQETTEEVAPVEEVETPVAEEVQEEVVESSEDTTVDGKALSVNDIQIGMFVEYKKIYENNGMEILRPEGWLIGLVVDIKSEGSVIGYEEVEQATPENPIITLQDHQLINGQFVPTKSYTICEYDDLWIEKQISMGTPSEEMMTASKEVEEEVIGTEEITDWNVSTTEEVAEDQTNTEDLEKQVKTLQDDNAKALETKEAELVSLKTLFQEQSELLSKALEQIKELQETNELQSKYIKESKEVVHKFWAVYLAKDEDKTTHSDLYNQIKQLKGE